MQSWGWSLVLSGVLVCGSVFAGDDTPPAADDKAPAAAPKAEAKPDGKADEKPKEGETADAPATEPPTTAPPAQPPATAASAAEPPPVAPAGPPVTDPIPLEPEQPRPEPNMPDDEGPSELTIAGGTLLALGGIGVIVGAIFGGIALSETDDANAQCPDKTCPPGVSAEEIKEDIRPKAEVSTIALTLGTATAITGIILLFVPENSEELAFDVQAGPRSGGLSVSGRF